MSGGVPWMLVVSLCILSIPQRVMPKLSHPLPTRKEPIRVYHGDCLELLPKLGACSIDSVVTDPPYGLAFMGKQWDSFGGKSNGRAAEDRDSSNQGKGAGLGNQPYGYSGSAIWDTKQQQAFYSFSLQWATYVKRLLKPGAYLLAFGGTRTFHRLMCAIEDAGFEICDTLSWMYGQGFPKGKSCLKPAWEPIILACKPGKRAEPLQIDACRLGGIDTRAPTSGAREGTGWGTKAGAIAGSIDGRWPPNVCMDEEAARMLDEQSGEYNSYRPDATLHKKQIKSEYPCYGDGRGLRITEGDAGTRYLDSGGASRFMYVAKASTGDRNQGLPEGTTNRHPTVKPIELMRWLVKLITPPEVTGEDGQKHRGVCLDPFMGSGTTLMACLYEKLLGIGIEQDVDSYNTARERIKGISGIKL